MQRCSIKMLQSRCSVVSGSLAWMMLRVSPRSLVPILPVVKACVALASDAPFASQPGAVVDRQAVWKLGNGHSSFSLAPMVTSNSDV